MKMTVVKVEGECPITAFGDDEIRFRNVRVFYECGTGSLESVVPIEQQPRIGDVVKLVSQ